jgi:hypothetical protein
VVRGAVDFQFPGKETGARAGLGWRCRASVEAQEYRMGIVQAGWMGVGEGEEVSTVVVLKEEEGARPGRKGRKGRRGACQRLR